MTNDVFTNLLRGIAERLGVEISMNEDEELLYECEDGVTGTISHASSREQIVLEARVSLQDTLSDQETSEFAHVLLLLNSQLMVEHSMSVAIAATGEIVVICLHPVSQVDAVQLADNFEEVVERARWLRSLPEELISASAADEGQATDFDNTMIKG